MIEGLKPYAEYKESKVPWIGNIPHDWRVERTKWIFHSRKELNVGRRNTNVLSLTLRGVVNNDPESPEGMVPKDYATYQLFRKDDLVFKLIDLENIRTSRVGLVHEDGIMSSAYVRLTPSEGVDVRFFYFQFFDLYKRAIFNALGAGVRSTLGAADLRELRIAIPPPDQQAAIVRFLDHANRQIDGFIGAKRKVVGLLNEQKQAIIHRAVTRGLHPGVPLKPSDIAWLGDIPKHWTVCPIKQTLLRMDYGTSESSTEDGKYRVLTMGHIQRGHVLVPDEGGINQIPAGLSLKTNDLLFNRTNSPELVGKVGIFSGRNEPPVTFASYLVRLRVRPEHNPSWLNYLLNSFRFWAFARSQALVSLHQANLNSSRYGRMNIPVPPRPDQDAIVDDIYSQTSAIDTAIARCEREIALMQEYRRRLTADLVTGKLDVREAAAKLPAPPSDAVAESVADETLEEIETEDAEA